MIDRQRYGYIVTTIFVFIVVLEVLDVINSFQWLYWWFDIGMHVLGGVFVGLLALFLYTFWHLSPHDSTKWIFLVSIFSVSFVAFLWEFLEYVLDVYILLDTTFTIDLTLSDTLSDFYFGLLGGALAATLHLIWQKA